MKKKSLLAIIAILIIVSSIGVMFVGCAKKTTTEDFIILLQEVITNSYGSNNLNNMDISANAAIEVKKDKEKKPTTYSFDFKTQLNLDNNINTRNNGIKIVAKEGDKTLLDIAYQDPSATASKGTMYVTYLNPFDANNKEELNIAVPNVNKVLADKNVDVDGAKVTEDIKDAAIFDAVEGIMDVINNEKGSVLNMRTTSKSAQFSLSLLTLLTNQDKKEQSPDKSKNSPVFGVLAELGLTKYMNALGIYLSTSDLAPILPNLVIDFKLNFDKKTKVINGLDIDIRLDKKDIKVYRSESNLNDLENPGTKKEETLVDFSIPSNYKVKVAVKDFKIGDGKLDMNVFNPLTQTGRAVSAVNFKVGGEITLGKDINVDLAALGISDDIMGILETVLGIKEGQKLGIGADTYNLVVEADIDPLALIDANFKQDMSPFIGGTGDAVQLQETKVGVYAVRSDGTALTAAEKTRLADNGVAWKMNSKGSAELNELVAKLASMINYANISLTGSAAANQHQITIQKPNAAGNAKITKFEALRVNATEIIKNFDLPAIAKMVVGLISPDSKIENKVDETGFKDAPLFNNKFIEDNKTNTEKPVTPPASNNELQNLNTWTKPLIDKLTILGGASAPDGCFISAKLASHTFQGSADGVMKDMLTIEVRELSIGNKGFKLDASVEIYTDGPDKTMNMIGGILGGKIDLKIVINKFIYGGCTPVWTK